MPFPTTALIDPLTEYAVSDALDGGLGNWEKMGSDAPLEFSLLSEGAAGVVSSSLAVLGRSYRTDYGGLTDCESWCEIADKPDNGDHIIVWARMGNPSLNSTLQTGYLVRATSSAGTDQIFLSRWDGAEVILQTFSQEFANGDLIGLQCIGNQISAWYQPGSSAWVLLGTSTDATYASGFIALGVRRRNGHAKQFGGGAVVTPSTTNLHLLPLLGVGR